MALGFAVGAVLMIAAGVVEAVLGVKAERRSLENIAKPLTADDDAAGPGQSRPPQPAPALG